MKYKNKRTLVYGLHTDFQKYRNWIEEHFDVKGYYDADETRLPDKYGIHSDEISNCINDFDIVLITADPVSIMMDLIMMYHVNKEKIKVLYYELIDSNRVSFPFYGSMTEDAVLALILEQLRVDPSDINYLEIGTNDPVRFNNTYGLYRRGSRGYLVDPLPAVGDLVGLVRPEDKFINAAISDRSGPDVEFYVCKSSTVSSLVKDHHKKWDGQSHNETSRISVPLIGINDLLDDMLYEPFMLLVDAEGYDEIIIRGIDFTKHMPVIIMVEVGHITSEIDDFDSFMISKGYIVYSQVDANRFYVKKEKMKC